MTSQLAAIAVSLLVASRVDRLAEAFLRHSKRNRLQNSSRQLSFCCLTFLAWLVSDTNQRAEARSLTSTRPIRTVAISGQHAVGTPIGVEYANFGSPLISESGHIAFVSFLSGPNVDDQNRTGIWVEDSAGQLRNIARTGDQAPKLEEGAVLETIFNRKLQLDDMGRVSFVVQLVRQGPIDFLNETAIYSEGKGQGLEVLAREGNAAPGTNLEFEALTTGTTPFLGPSGVAAFAGELRPHSTTDIGIWSDQSGTLELVVREGEQVPGLPPGVTLRSIAQSTPISINPEGNLAFIGSLCTCSDLATPGSAVLVQDRPNGFRLVTASGEQAPGLDNGVLFRSFTSFGNDESIGFNNSGEIAFFSDLTGTGVSDSNESSLWSEGGGELHLVAREGNQAPDVEDGLVFARFGAGLTGNVALNDHGEVVFTAPLRFGDDPTAFDVTAVWSENPDLGLRAIAVEGDAAPGTEPGTVFGGSLVGGIDSQGRHYVYGNLTGPSIDDGNNIGIWSGFDLESLSLLVRKGDSIEIAPGDVREIKSFPTNFHVVTGLSEGRPAGFNDRGEVAFHVTFTDGAEGIFVLIVPEPLGLVQCAIGLTLASVVLGRLTRNRIHSN